MQRLQGCLCRTSKSHFLAKKFVITKMRSNYTKCINRLVPRQYKYPPGRPDCNQMGDRANKRRSSDQKESPVDWTPRGDVTRQATKAGSLFPTVFWSEKERTPSSTVQGYHQEKPEAERHKD